MLLMRKEDEDVQCVKLTHTDNNSLNIITTRQRSQPLTSSSNHHGWALEDVVY